LKHFTPAQLQKIYIILGVLSLGLLVWGWFPNKDIFTKQSLIKKIESMHQLGQFYANKGDYSKAHDFFYEAYDLGLKSLEKEDSLYLTSLNNVAWIEKLLGNYPKSLELFKQIYQTRVRLFGQEDPITINVMINLATLHFFSGNISESEKLYQQIIELRSKAFGVNHIYTFYSHIHLAGMYRLSGNPHESLDILLKTFPKIQKYYGTKHSGTKYALKELSLTYIALEQFVDAEFCLYQILQHPAYSSLDDRHSTQTNLANVYRELGMYDEALFHLSIVLSERREFYGFSDLLTAAVHTDIAKVHYASGNHTDAIREITQARLISQNKLGSTHSWRMSIEQEFLNWLKTGPTSSPVGQELSRNPLP
jgi:tetratricopeptide (TPR) repeat protein